MGNKKYKGIYMKIDYDLYRKSKVIIKDRTKDYEDYLQRRITVNNRAELLKLEIEELDERRKALMKEYDTELELQGQINTEDKTIEDIAKTCINIIENLGYIGLDKMETIADLHDVSLAELKKTIPTEYHEKFVKYHTDPQPEICDQVTI
ncbi:MAG: hypothetical protein ABFC34_08055 [Methanobacterium sp.]